MADTNDFARMGRQFARPNEYQAAELYLTGCGIQRCHPGYSFAEEAHRDHCLAFVLGGNGLYRHGPLKYRLSKGDIFWLPENKRVFFQSDEKNPLQLAWVTFGGSYCSVYLDYGGFSESAPVHGSRISGDIYLGVIQEIMQQSEDTPASELFRLSKLYILLSVLIDDRSVDSAGENRGREYSVETHVEYAREFIAYHYATANVNDIAKHLGVSRAFLNSAFQKILNVSPQTYLLDFRMEKAKELLGRTSASLKEIGEGIGYDDPFVFSKMFKKKSGLSPRHYRDMLKNTEEADSNAKRTAGISH